MKDKIGKTEIGGERRNVVWSMRDLDNKGLGQNKVLYGFSVVKLLMVNYHVGSLAHFALGRHISGYTPTSSSWTALTRIFSCHLFLVASFGVLFSASCQSSSFSFYVELDCWLTWWHTKDNRSSSSQYSDQYLWWGWKLGYSLSSLYLWI